LLDPSNDPEFFWQVISGPPCIVDSVQNKLEVSSKILGKEQIINITQSDNVAPKVLLKECNNVVVNIYNK
jgi:hypothetical protein